MANLASWFHQDFKLMGIEPDQWGREFIKSLSVDQKRALRAELLELAAAYPGKSGKGLRNAWARLGAQCWPRSANLRDTIQMWAEAIE
jgi:CdiI immunity protein